MCTFNGDELQVVIGTMGIRKCTDVRYTHTYGMRMGRTCGQQQKRDTIGREKTHERKGLVKKQN
jgi:hypothetical protein